MTIPRVLRFTERELRVACYLLGPLMALPIFLRRSEFWSVRFHAAHSLLTSAFCAASWGVLRVLEHISPTWFLGAVMREARYLVNLIWALLWVALLITAYSGVRFVILPWLHVKAVRFARRYEPSEPKADGPVLQAN